MTRIQKPIFRTLPNPSTAVWFVLLVISVALWAWTVDWPGPARRTTASVAVDVPGVTFQAAALSNGVHFQVFVRSYNRSFGVEFGRARFRDGDRHNSGYPGHAWFVSALGFIAAWLPTTVHDYDVILTPFAAAAIPYWFLIAGSAALLFGRTGMYLLLKPYRSGSLASLYAAALVLLAFFVLNLVPTTAWRPGINLQPSTLWGWGEITFWPGIAHHEVALKSGFPFECYRRAFIAGRRVDVFHGDDTQGILQHRLMDNVCIALVCAWTVSLAVERARQRFQHLYRAREKPVKVAAM